MGGIRVVKDPEINLQACLNARRPDFIFKIYINLDTGSHDRVDHEILPLDIVPVHIRHIHAKKLSRKIERAYAAANSDSS